MIPIVSYLYLSLREYLSSTSGYLEFLFFLISAGLYLSYQESDFFYTLICITSFFISNIINMRILSRQSGSLVSSAYSTLGTSQIIKYIPILSAFITLIILLPLMLRDSGHIEPMGFIRICLFILTSTYLSTALLILTQGLKQTGGRLSWTTTLLIGFVFLVFIPLTLFYFGLPIRQASVFCLCNIEVWALLKFSVYFVCSLIMLKIALWKGHFDPEVK